MKLPNAGIMPIPTAGPNRTILLLDGEVAQVKLIMRSSTTAHARVKAAFAVPVDETRAAGVAEFRLEMN